ARRRLLRVGRLADVAVRHHGAGVRQDRPGRGRHGPPRRRLRPRRRAGPCLLPRRDRVGLGAARPQRAGPRQHRRRRRRHVPHVAELLPPRAALPAMSGVELWWAFLIAVSAVNIALWLRLRRQVASDEQRRQLRLSGVFVFVCAFRSLLPRADVQRICLVDSFLSSVLVGRAVATAAELCFMAQIAATLRALGRELDYARAVTVAGWVLP